MKKWKLLFSISSLCFAFAVLCFGVFAATSVTYNLGGTITYDIEDVFVKINARVYKVKNQKTEEEMNTDISELATNSYTNIEAMTNVDSSSKYTLSQTMNEFDSTADLDIDSYDAKDSSDNSKGVEIKYSREAYTYYIVVNVENLLNGKNVYAYLTSNITLADGANTILTTNKKQDNIAKGETKNIVIGFSLQDRLTPISASGIDFSCSIKVDYTGKALEDVTGFNFYVDESTKTATVSQYTGDNTTVNFPSSVSKDAGGNWIAGDDYKVTAIASRVINTSSVQAVKIPSGVERIDADAFQNCSSLSNLYLPSTITSIGTNAFGGYYMYIPETNGLKILTASDNSSVKYLVGCNISLTSIASNALDGVKAIAEGVFGSSCQIETITLPSSLKTIGDSLFSSNTNLKTVTINEGVTKIGNYAFSGCHALTTVTVPNSVISIGDGAFNQCNALTTLTIPSGVSSIGKDAFTGTPWYNNLSTSCSNGLVIYENSGTKFLLGCTGSIPYEVTSAMLSGVKVIAGNAFNYGGTISLTTITIPSTVVYIGSQAFNGGSCSNLSSVTFESPNGWTTLYNNPYNGKIENVNLNLSDSSENATFLKSTYERYPWIKG